MRTPRILTQVVAVTVVSLLPTIRSAETPAPTAPASEEVVQISPFEVRTDRDVGWVAASTLAGNRTDTELVNVGATVDAITTEFMRDLGVYKLEDVAQFVANVDVVSENETSAEEQRVNFRGMQLGGRENAQSSRNFFAWFTPTDSYNIDRIDFSKGANSLIYGDSIPGGTANSYTKRARFKNSAEATARYDSFDSHRVQLDVNRKLTKNLAARVNLVDRDDRSYIEYAHSSLRAAHGAVTYRPFEHTQVRFEAETGKFKRIRGTNTLSIRPSSAPGLGFNTTNRWYYTSDGEIRYVTTSNTSSVDRSAAAGTALSLMEGQTVVVSLMNRVGSTNVPSGETISIHGYPRDTNLRGSIDFLDRPYTTYTAYVEQQIGKLSLELAFNRQDQEQDRTDGTFTSTVSFDRRGRPFTDFSINKRAFGDHVRIVRATASYPFEFGSWTRQFIVVSAESQRDQLYNFRHNLANFAALASGPTNITNQQILFRAYLDDPAYPSESFWTRFRPENLPVTNTFHAGWYDTTTTDLPFIDIRTSRAYSGSLAGRYWKDRIHTLIGVRHDEFKRKRITNLPQDAIGQYIFLGDENAAPQAYEFDPAYDLKHTSYTASVVFKPTKETSVYGTYAESFRWQPYEMFTGKPLGPVLGETYETGVKTSLLDGKVFGTFGVYRTDRSNVRYTWSPDVLSPSELEDLFNPNNLSPGSPGYFVPAPGANDEYHTVPATERAQGFEATLQCRRIAGVQARLTFSHNNISVLRDFSLFKSYLEAAIQRGNEDPTLIADAQRILAANEGVEVVTGSRSTKNLASWAVDYQFPRTSVLKGTRVAVYGNWRDKYNLEVLSDASVYRGGASHPVGAYIMHERKLLGRATAFRLGLRNIVDLANNDKMRIVGVATETNGVPSAYTYRYVTPFSADFSVTIDL